MLERASACFQTGAQRTLHCAKKASRSQRKLHSSFWNHGAGALDLPPWALPVPATTTVPRLKIADNDKSEARTGAASSDSVFLDFLYPPQALAWLHRTNGQARERWESRNARCLPEGFILALRKQSSRSFTHRAAQIVEHEHRAHGDVDVDQGGNSKEQHAQEDAQPHAQGPAGDSQERSIGWGHSSERHREKMQDTKVSHFVGFAESPGELAEQETLDEPSEKDTQTADAATMKDLRQRLRQSLHPAQPGLIAEIWQVYTSLNKDEASNDELKLELVKWLAGLDHRTADEHIISLFATLSPSSKALDTYNVVLAAFLRLGRYDAASALHKDALQTLSNSKGITQSLFRHAITQELLPLALDIYRDQDKLSDERATKLFWLKISDIPDLLDHVHNLVQQEANTKTTQSWTEVDTRFIERLTVETIDILIRMAGAIDMPPRSRQIPRGKIRLLFARMLKTERGTPFVERSILRLLRSCGTPQAYDQWHHVISYLYIKLRGRAGFKPPAELFILFLRHLMSRFSHKQTLRRTDISVSIELLVKDYKKHHGRLDLAISQSLVSMHALRGQITDASASHAYLERKYPDYEQYKDSLASLIYAHARIADVDGARRAFIVARDQADAHHAVLDPKCWNNLLHAHAKAEDLDGASKTFTEMMSDKTLKLDARPFQIMMSMWAATGDVEAVESLLNQYDTIVGTKQHTSQIGALLIALLNNGHLKRATGLLRRTVDKVRVGEIQGSLTGSFNILMTAYARQRDLEGVMQVHRWMEKAQIRADASTYAALIQALVYVRSAGAAAKLLKKMMNEDHIRPEAFHFALVMAGHLRQREPDQALQLHSFMRTKNILETVSVRRVYLQAKAARAAASKNPQTAYSEAAISESVDFIVAEIRDVLDVQSVPLAASKEPSFGEANLATGWGLYSYVASLATIHGSKACTQALSRLVEERSNETSSNRAQTRVPMRLLASYMASLLRENSFADMEACWGIAKTVADGIAKLKPLPNLESAQGPGKEVETQPVEDLLDLALPLDRNHNSVSPASGGASAAGRNAKPPIPSLVPTLRHILARPLTCYIQALAAENRITDAITAVSRLLTQGYTLDNVAWNAFVQILCSADPPLVLLAFVLTERHLIVGFPGWIHRLRHRQPRYAHIGGMQHMNPRHLRPGELVPRYRTLVMLGGALLKLRRFDAGVERAAGELEKYVGSLRRLRQLAPKTLLAVQSMPRVRDDVQDEQLRTD